MGDLQYGAKLPEKKSKEEFLAHPIRGYLTEDDTTLDNSSMGRSRKRNRHSKKEQHAKDEPFSLEDNQDSFVSSKKRNTRGRRKRVGKSRKRKVNGQKQSRATILSWLINCDVIKENVEVVVIEEETRKKLGKIKKEGILCSCCCTIFTVGDFYKYTGGTTSKHYEYILIAETCSSLLSSMVKAYFTNVGSDAPTSHTRS
uniref:Acetyltransferase, GNAT family protein n=1 Tax=Solanum tuberosum TaxID=4113 RepID=M1DLZ9_SOLTU